MSWPKVEGSKTCSGKRQLLKHSSGNTEKRVVPVLSWTVWLYSFITIYDADLQVLQSRATAEENPFVRAFWSFANRFCWTLSEGKKYCPVIVDTFSKWVEAFPTSKADAGVVPNALVREIIPRWGIPQKIISDNGTHFIKYCSKKSRWVSRDWHENTSCLSCT